MSQRSEFLQYFFQAAKPLEYALLKQFNNDVHLLPETSDIDLVIDGSERKEFLDILHQAPNLDGLHLHKKTYVTFASLYFRDGSYLEIDLIHRFDRKGIIYMSAQDVINGAATNDQGVKFASLKHNFEYIVLFHIFNQASVPVKYQQFFNKLSKDLRNEIFGYICNKYDLYLLTIDELFHPNHRESKKLKATVLENWMNKSVFRGIHSLRYVVDLTNDLLNNPGRIITFSGVDGAGKSTVLEQVRQTLQEKYRQKTVVLRHRPSVLPILSSLKYGRKEAESRTTQTLPRQGKNSGSLSSFLRFLYYFLDYQLGQVVVYFKYVLRGYTVLYDRYYFDFIIDARRSNIDLPPGLLKWCYHFILKPGVNVYLYAPTEVILSRKQEMSEQDIQQLNREYTLLFNELQQTYKHQRYIAVSNTNLSETLRIVINQCISPEIHPQIA